MKLLGQYTVPESWESDTNGNARYIYENIVYPLVQNEDITTVIIVMAEGNTSDNYRLTKMVGFAATYNMQSGSGAVLRFFPSNSGYSIRAINEQTSAWCSAGTVLKIYRI